MAEYKEVHGTKIRNYTTDPDNPITGEVWYNETTKTLKFQYPTTTTSGSWRSGANLNTARRHIDGAGSSTAGLAIGGYTGSPSALTESYNGTAWTEVNDLGTARYGGGGFGTQTSALLGGGGYPYKANTELFNGTNWTEVNDLNAAKGSTTGAGADNTAGIIAGGGPAPTAAQTELWN